VWLRCERGLVIFLTGSRTLLLLGNVKIKYL
jgi:hypothetical protein